MRDQWRTITQPLVDTGSGVEVLRRYDVIEPAAPLVPRDDNRGAVPVLTLADRVDDRHYPRRAAAALSVAGMIGCALVRHHPGYPLQLLTGDIGENLYIGRHDVLVIRPVRIRWQIRLLIPPPRDVRDVQLARDARKRDECCALASAVRRVFPIWQCRLLLVSQWRRAEGIAHQRIAALDRRNRRDVPLGSGGELQDCIRNVGEK